MRGLAPQVTGGEMVHGLPSRQKSKIFATFLCTKEALFRLLQHILNENSISPRWVADKNVGDRAYQLAVLQNG